MVMALLGRSLFCVVVFVAMLVQYIFIAVLVRETNLIVKGTQRLFSVIAFLMVLCSLWFEVLILILVLQYIYPCLWLKW